MNVSIKIMYWQYVYSFSALLIISTRTLLVASSLPSCIVYLRCSSGKIFQVSISGGKKDSVSTGNNIISHSMNIFGNRSCYPEYNLMMSHYALDTTIFIPKKDLYFISSLKEPFIWFFSGSLNPSAKGGRG